MRRSKRPQTGRRQRGRGDRRPAACSTQNRHGGFSLLGDTSGETLVESLISVLIVAAVFLMLCTAIVTAAKINAKAAAIDTSFDETSADGVTDVERFEVKFTSVLGTSSAEVTGHVQNGYVYYG